MPNYCNNYVSIHASHDTIARIKECLIGKMEGEINVFDFNRIIPKPAYIYDGLVGPAEKKKYGENNWYDWSCKNWGTKWNSVDAEIQYESDTDLEYSFLTAWAPSEPVIRTIAEVFPNAQIDYSFYETGCCFCGKRQYENGSIIYQADGDYFEMWNYDDDPEEDVPKYEIGTDYSTEGKTEYGNALKYDFVFRDTDKERTILIKGHCIDGREEKTDFSW